MKKEKLLEIYSAKEKEGFRLNQRPFGFVQGRARAGVQLRRLFTISDGLPLFVHLISIQLPFARPLKGFSKDLQRHSEGLLKA